MLFRLFMPKQAVGANLVYFDMFNAAAANADVAILSVRPVVSGAVAVTGTLGVDLFLTRTSAVGTGGTAATSEGTSLTAATWSGLDCQEERPPELTARLTPSGGATAGAVLGFREVFTEETNAATYEEPPEFVPSGVQIIVPGGTGIRVVQGAVASVGNIGFDVLVRVTKR